MIEKLIHGNKIKKSKIMVVGDIAIDDYRNGKISRISPEFPLPILNSHSTLGNIKLGMAGNVCHQMKHFNVEVFLLGFIDEYTSSILKDHFSNTNYCVNFINGKNPLKVRFYEDDHPLFRWDIEQHNYGESVENLIILRQKLFDNFKSVIENNKIDIVILSDYNKGLFDEILIQKIINTCNEHNIPTIVDPKNPPLSQWKNCTYFKPNSNEIKKLTNSNEIDKQILQIKKELNCNGIVVTCGGDGVIGSIDNKDFTYMPKENTTNEKVNSRIGAGDAYIAILAICLSHQIGFDEGCKIAFEAGSKYVQHKHNKPISIFEIKERLNPIECKIINVEDLKELMNYLGGKWIWTNGCFDVSTHSGHLKTLEICNKLGDYVIVGLNTDESIKRLKGPDRPILSWAQRAENLAHLQYVNFIVPVDENTPRNIIKKLKPDIIVKGEEYKDKYVAGGEDINEWGGKVVFVPMIPNLSTTAIIEKMKNYANNFKDYLNEKKIE